MSSRILGIAMAGLFLTLAALTGMLAWQNLQLKERLAELDPLAGALSPGDVVDLETLTGGRDSRPPAGDAVGRDGPTLLLAYSRTCPGCKQMMPFWNELAGQIESASVDVLGLEVGHSPDAANPDGVRAQFESLFTDFSDTAELRRQIPVVPATVLVDGRGVVQRAWFGVLDERDRHDLRQLLGVG